MTDEREQYWQRRFSELAKSAVNEHEVNSYGIHGWLKRQQVFKQILDELFMNMSNEEQPDAQALDVGCGSGAFSRILAEYGFNVTGVDLSEAMLEAARRHSNGVSNLSFVQSPCTQLPASDDSCRLVSSVGMIQHVSDLTPFLDECNRVLSHKGGFVFITLNRFTVITLIRRMFKSLDPDAVEPPQNRLRRFCAHRLKREIKRAMPGMAIRIKPIYIFPKPVRLLERIVELPIIAKLAYPLAVSFAVYGKRS